MQMSKYIILPLLLIGSALVGNPDKVKPTLFGRIAKGFDRITNRIGNSRLFNPSIETMIRTTKALTIGTAGVAAYLVYEIVKIDKGIKEGQEIRKARKKADRRLEVETYKNTIAKQKEQLLDAKRQESFHQSSIAKQQGEVEYYKNMVDKYQKLVSEIQREQIKQNEPWYNKIPNLFNFSKK